MGIKDVLFDNPSEFYTNFWKYNEFIRVFESSGFSKWGKINALLKIVGDSESPAQRYRDRTYLMQNLKTEPFNFGKSTYLPAFNQPTGRPNRYNFFANSWGRPWFKTETVGLNNQAGTETS